MSFAAQSDMKSVEVFAVLQKTLLTVSEKSKEENGVTG